MCVVSNSMRSEKIRFQMAALLLTLGLAASITACAGSQNTESNEDSAPTTEETLTEEIPETEESAETEKATESLE